MVRNLSAQMRLFRFESFRFILATSTETSSGLGVPPELIQIQPSVLLTDYHGSLPTPDRV
jgi:hypothetical protein